MVICFHRSKQPLQRVNIRGEDVHPQVPTGTWGCTWTASSTGLWTLMRSTGRARAGSSSWEGSGPTMSVGRCCTCSSLSVVESTIFYAALCWGGSATERDTRRLDKPIWKAGSVLGRCLDSLGVVVERRMWTKLSDIMDNTNHPLHHTLMEQSCSHSGRLTALRSRTERHMRSFVPVQ